MAKERGYSLVEALTAAVLLAVGLAALAGAARAALVLAEMGARGAASANAAAARLESAAAACAGPVADTVSARPTPREIVIAWPAGGRTHETLVAGVLACEVVP
jgi:Tfp pilus assembly protein PilV